MDKQFLNINKKKINWINYDLQIRYTVTLSSYIDDIHSLLLINTIKFKTHIN